MHTCVKTGTADPRSPYSPVVCHQDSAPSAGLGTLPVVVAVNSEQQNLSISEQFKAITYSTFLLIPFQFILYMVLPARKTNYLSKH